jgi:PKD repeat protein
MTEAQTMTNETSRRHRAWTTWVSLIVLAFGVQLLSMNALAQDAENGSKRLLSKVSANWTTNLKASFSCTPRYPSAGQAVQFTDTSTGGPTSWSWDFGDGSTSTLQNPQHSYAAPGFRRITLTVTSTSGAKRANRTITVMPGTASATFVFSPSTPGPGQTVQFADTTAGDPTSWRWDFGDGSTSTAKNPSHVYLAAASYSVSLTANTSSGSCHGSRTLTVASITLLSAAFSFAPASPVPGQAVQFTDMSTGNPTSWLWNFGDGSTSAAQNPSHIFAAAGSRSVTLTVSNATGSNTTTRTLTVAAGLTASFSYSPSSPAAGQTVEFTDASTGNPTSWLWNFGDGSTSTAQNPSHTFAAAGSRTVTLTVSNATGSNTATRTLTVAAGLTASFSYSPTSPANGQTVQFTDTSTAAPTLWQWNFGDGSTSVSQNPSHAFAAAGSYNVTLTIMNASGQDTASRTLTVVQVDTVTASFTNTPASPAAGQAVQFTDTSRGNPTSWSWNFNDGSTSTERNPSHAFATAGSYTVTLVASNGTGSDTSIRTVSVTPATAPVASFSLSPVSPAAGQTVRFTDTSTGGPTSWLWDFGDGSTSTAQNPNHAFAAAASYNVLLTVTNAGGSDGLNRVVTVVPGSSDVHYAASPASTDIQAAIDAAADGDTVLVPAGSATWTSNVTISAAKGVRLIGAGSGSTNINLNNAYCLTFYPRQANQPVRISGFSFTNCPAPSLQINDYSVGSNNWRVDHCSWTNGGLGTEINVHGHTFGVIDNCTFTNTLRTFWVDGQVRPFDTSGSPMPYPGGYSWQQPLTMGGADAVYVEDCTIHNATASIFHNMRGGARFVFRHNTVTGLNGLETHSGCTPGYRNPRWIEIYENTFDLQGLGSYWCGLFLRSTNGVVFNNRFSSGYPIAIRFDVETVCLDSCAMPWPGANRTAYPAQDQVGAGRDTGWGTSQATDEAKLWIWGNTQASNAVSPQFTSCGNSAEMVQLGRDYFLSAPARYTPYAYPHPLRND